MKRQAKPQISPPGAFALAHYEQTLREREDLMPALTRSRTSFQIVQRQKPTWVNRSLISLKRSFGWAIRNRLITCDSAAAVKLIGQEETSPRHLDDQEEQALVAVVTKVGYRMAESVPLHRLAQMMGHDSLDTTRVSIQGTRQHLQQAVETIAWT